MRSKRIRLILVGLALVVGIAVGSGVVYTSQLTWAADSADAAVAIKNTVAKYCRGYDYKDLDLLMSVWADDANVVWKDIGWDLKGKAAIKEGYTASMAAWSNSRHNVYNWDIEVSGDTAKSQHYWAWHADDKEGTTWAGEGRYYREFIKQGDVWKIKFQEIFQDRFAPQNQAEAIQQIKNVVANYCRGYDYKDLDLLMSVWADDANVVWKDVNWDLKGKAAIKEGYTASMNAWSKSRHNVYNWDIDVNGNAAKSNHCWAWHAENAEGKTFAGEGRYYREFVKQGGVWKIKFQEIFQDWFGAAAAWP
jgi:ketosteroid isomerase-like protein